MSASRPGVLFDLDGTLVDTNYLHTVAWARALADCGEWAPMNAIHRLVGMGGEQLVPTLLGREIPSAHDRRAEHYRQLLGDVRAFPRAADLLRRLHDAGATVVLATSSPGADLDASLEALGAGDALDVLVSSDDVAHSKPSPDIFQAGMDRAGLDGSLVVAVGDTIWDVQAARACGIGCVGVETGGFSRHELGEEGALAVYRDVGELLAQLRIGPLSALLG
jgi:HAD superfamily hydrolase (TIGR01509 family)